MSNGGRIKAASLVRPDVKLQEVQFFVRQTIDQMHKREKKEIQSKHIDMLASKLFQQIHWFLETLHTIDASVTINSSGDTLDIQIPIKITPEE